MMHYSVKKVYDTLVGEQERIHQDGIAWNRMNLPNHRFIIWLAIQGKLQTTTRLVVIGVSYTDSCLLCAQHKEDHQHLFFKCPFSLACLSYFKGWMKCSTQTDDLQHLLRWIQNNRRTKFQKHVFLAGVTMVYMIWQSRNKVY